MENLIIVVAVVVIVAGLLFFRKSRSPNRPVKLHANHGGGVCENPNWEKVRNDFYQALVDVGNDSGAQAYKDYTFQDEPDKSTRTHYELHGQNYPSDIHPCV